MTLAHAEKGRIVLTISGTICGTHLVVLGRIADKMSAKRNALSDEYDEKCGEAIAVT